MVDVQAVCRSAGVVPGCIGMSGALQVTPGMAPASRAPAESMATSLSRPFRNMTTQQHPTPSLDEEEQEAELQRQYVEEGNLCRHDHDHDTGLRVRYKNDGDGIEGDEQMGNHLMSAGSSKRAEETVMPFLTEHIPNLLQRCRCGGQAACRRTGSRPRSRSCSRHRSRPVPERANTQFCYRHRPDLKCRRQANEPSMDQLQNELATLSQSDQQAISHVWSLFSAAPAKHRNLMLQGILAQCCFPQLSLISANVRDLIKIDFLAALPAELGFKILCYLDTTSLCKAAQVSTRWRGLADDDVVWHRMCEQHIDRKCTKCGWGLPLLEQKRLRIEKRQIQLRAMGQGLNEWSPAITPIPVEYTPTAEGSSPTGTKRLADEGLLSPESAKRTCTSSVKSETRPAEGRQDGGYFSAVPRKRPWKDVYKDRFKVGLSWKYGRFSTKVFKGHTNGVMALQFDDNVLITGSYDTTVKVWDINSGEELRTLTGHTSGIRCLQFDDQKLMTGSLDSTLRLWNWRTGKCLRTFEAHTGGIISLNFTRRYVATGSMDRTVRVWDADTKQTFLLRGHTDWVNSVKVDEASRTLFSASDDLTVKVWDLDTRECIRSFEGHVGQVQQVQPMPAEFELDDHNPSTHRLGDDKDDDASSVASSSHHHQSDRQHTPAATAPDREPFWKDSPERPAPPRYMLTSALDSTIRLWDVHFDPHDPSHTSSHTNSHSNHHSHHPNPHHPANTNTNPDPTFTILPTDPLTNSHTPRAQACLRTFFGHVEGIWALAADHLRLVSGSEDRMMKVWDPRTARCERTFTGHRGPVTCVGLSESRVGSGGEDGEVRVMCFD